MNPAAWMLAHQHLLPSETLPEEPAISDRQFAYGEEGWREYSVADTLYQPLIDANDLFATASAAQNEVDVDDFLSRMLND